MSLYIIIQFFTLIILLALSFFFSSAETALTTVNRFKMRTLAEEGNDRAALVLAVTDDKSRMLSAILIGNNIVNLSSSSLATILAVHLLGSYGAGIATGLLTFLILIFGEITPKSLATMESARLSMQYVRIIWILMVILTPVIRFINSISWWLLNRMGVYDTNGDGIISAQDLKTIVDVGHETGAIEEDEKEMLHNVFDFSDTTVKEIMVPRIDMTIANINWSYDRLMEEFSHNMFTRIPVYEDDTDNIVGILNMKDLLRLNQKSHFSLRRLMREAHFTYELKKTSDLFEEMRHQSIALTIVLDEFGAVAGLVTLEDLIEELVGEIRDEFDSYETDNIVKVSPREYYVMGNTNLEDLMQEIPLGFTSEDYDTIGGYLTGLFDHFPKTGEIYVTENGVILSVAEVKRRRIQKVHIRLPEAS